MTHLKPLHPSAAHRMPARVLVVDDEPNIRLLLRATLEGDGHFVAEAPDGAVALNAIRSQRFDLVVLDLNMPVLDGLGLLARLSDDGGVTEPGGGRVPEPRVIVLTAYGSVPVAVRATRLGALDFLEKPITPDELRTTVAAVLAEPQRALPAPAHADAPDYAGTLERVRQSLRVNDVATAESLLMRAADLGQHDAGYFNLLGVIYELRRQWRLAKKMYGRAARADSASQPARQNLKRIYELEAFGRTSEPVALGDGGDALAALLARGHESA